MTLKEFDEVKQETYLRGFWAGVIVATAVISSCILVTLLTNYIINL